MSEITTMPLDPIAEEVLERALAPYRGLVSPAVFEAMREELADALCEHPVALELRRRLRPRPVLQESNTVDMEGRPAEPGTAAAKKVPGGAR